MPTPKYVFHYQNVENATWELPNEFIGESPSRARYCNIVTASVFCRSATSSHKFHLRWILKTADPFFLKIGIIEDKTGAQKTVKRHFWKIICRHFYSKEMVKFGKFVPFFDRLRIFFIFSRISLKFEACRSQQSQFRYSPNTFLINIFYLKKIAFE